MEDKILIIESIFERLMYKQQSEVVGRVAALQLYCIGFNINLGLLSVYSFACSPCINSDFLKVLWFPPTSSQYMPVGGVATLNMCKRVC